MEICDKQSRVDESAKPQAWLLLGPTGAGKTPLGEALARHGLCGHPCCHLDFGQALRDVERRGVTEDWPATDVRIVRDLLHTGRLLENDTFYIAERIVGHFIDAMATSPQPLLILNGLPRHIEQAAALESMLVIRQIILLECSAETVRARISMNTGGDRSGRLDDDAAAIEHKLAIFRDRTRPLINYYTDRGVEVTSLSVGATSTAMDMLALLPAWRNRLSIKGTSWV